MANPAESGHNQHLKYLDRKEIDALYWSVFIKGIGDSLISIFTAIYLLHLGFTVKSVAIYYIIYFFVYSALSRSSMKLGSLIGVKKSLAAGIVFFIIYYQLLITVKSGLPYQFVALIYGGGAALYWSAFQIDLSRALRSRSAGKALSSIQIITIISGIAGPLIGALFIIKASFAALFIVVSVALIASALPLLKRGDYKISGEVATVKDSIKSGTMREAWMYGLYGLTESAVDILWPVFLYLHYPHILSLGGIISFTSLLMVAVFYFNGKLADKDPLQAYKVGVLTNAPTWILRLLWLTPGGLLIGNMLGTATSSLVNITVDQHMYKKAKHSDNATAPLLFRNYYSAVGRISVLALVAALNSTTFVFVLISVIVFLQYLVRPRKTFKPTFGSIPLT